MFFPVLLASAVAIAVEIPERSEPGSHPVRLAIVMSDGDVLVSRDHGETGIVAARCPARSASEDVSSTRRPQSLDDAPEAEEHALDVASPATSSIAPANDAAEAPEEELPGPRACDQPQSAAQVAWFGGALYLACTRGSLHRWREDTGLWPVLPAPPAEPEDSPSQSPPTVPGRIVAMSAGAQLQLVDDGGELWSSHDGERFRALGSVPEPAIAVAEGNAAVIVAGATAVWQRADADADWQPVLAIRACALAAHGDALWLAGPAGLVEITRDRARVHTIVPLTGAAARDGTLWLASGRGPVVHAPLDAIASVLAGPRDPASDDTVSAAVTVARLHRARVRARWARLLPRVTAQARWIRTRSQRAMLSESPELDPGAARSSRDVAFLIWLTWSLGDSATAFGTATRSWP